MRHVPCLAVILAAGVGSRLGALTKQKAKCTVRVAGKPVLDHQLSALRSAGIRRVVIVVGHEQATVREAAHRFDELQIEFVENTKYATTNNMYSLYLTKSVAQGHPFLLLNGDVVFDDTIVSDLVTCPKPDLIAAEKGSYADESMKIVVGQDDLVRDISKKITPREAYGNSIDVYKFSGPASELLFKEAQEIIEVAGDKKHWTEVALQQLVQSGRWRVAPFDIGGRRWVEIDNLDDLSRADMAFAPLHQDLKGKKLAFIDMDGTLYNGSQLIEGAAEFLEQLRRRSVHICLLSNNSSRSKAQYVEKLASMGVVADESEVVLSSDGLIQHLLTQSVRRVYVLGTKALRTAIRQAGITHSDRDAEAVVLGYDTELTYKKLRTAALLLQRPIPFLATHCDVVCPTPDGPVPDIGSFMALLKAATGRVPDRIFGKPDASMVEHVLSEYGVAAHECFLVGDRLYTDHLMAQAIGCDFIAVLSGESDRSAIEEATHFPALVAPSVGYLMNNTAVAGTTSPARL